MAQFEILGMKDDHALRRQLETDLAGLRELIELTSARVALQHQRETTPPCQAMVTLGVSGPDIQAAARDHSWPAVWGKVMNRLREQIEKRRARQKERPPNRTHNHSRSGDRTKH